jgi:c-di-GMP-binding flagellar brake protein YcgR
MTDRRKEPRKTEENKVAIQFASEELESHTDKTIHALTQDISTGGFKILTDAKFKVGNKLKLRLVLSKTHKVLDLEGTVRWIKSVYENELYEVGVEFQDVHPDQTMLLLKHVYETGLIDEE